MATQPVVTTKGHCPRCNTMTNAHIRARHATHWHDKEDNVHGVVEYLILQCAGCDRIYFQIADSNTYNVTQEWNNEINDYEWIEEQQLTHYPAETRRNKPEFMSEVELHDQILEGLIKELYAALNADLRVLAAIGMRTIFDRTSEILKVDPNKSFGDKLVELMNLGKIGTDEKEILKVLVDAGNAAAHRGWSPTVAEVYMMMDVVEAFLKRTFVLDASMKKLAARVPPKPPKKS